MTTITTRAPGKLFLLGEYVVLFGGPAVVMAVDRYVTVTLRSSVGDYRVKSMGPDIPELTGHWQKDRILWDHQHPDHRLVTTILDALCESHLISASTSPFDCTIDSRDFFEKGAKLGLGSSAAVTNALIDAVARYNKNQSVVRPDAALNLNAHRAFQYGRGSGADIAAGLMGGVFVYQRALDFVLPEMTRVDLPAGLHLLWIWAGKPASTAEALSTIHDYQRRHPGQFTEAITPLLSLADEGVRAIELNDAGSFARVCSQYCQNLSDFGRKVGVDILSDAHQSILDMARAHGVAYKPSGAGSGDFGLALSNDINRLQDLRQTLATAGLAAMDFVPGEPGHCV